MPARSGSAPGTKYGSSASSRPPPWLVVKSHSAKPWSRMTADIVASSPSDKEALFEPANSKVYRHPTFFPMPEEVKNL